MNALARDIVTLHITPAVRVLIDSYKTQASVLTERDRAALEVEIWRGIPPGGIGTDDRRAELAELLGDTTVSILNRYHLHCARELANPLWERIENRTMARGTAVRLLRRAGERAAKLKIPKEQALKTLIDEYDKAPKIQNAEGVSYARYTGNKYSAGLGAKKRSEAEASLLKEFQVETEVGDLEEADPTSSRSFWFRVRKALKAYMKPRMEGIDDIHAFKILEDFENDLKVACETAQRRISAEAKRNKEGGVAAGDVNRRELLEACKSLHMNPPSFGKPVDLKHANKQKKRLAALYHPDTNAGGENVRSLFESVMNAYHRLEEYAEKYGTTS